MFSLFRSSPGRRANRYVVLPLDDPQLYEHAQHVADFAREHRGAGHSLLRVDDGRRKGQTIICTCSGATNTVSRVMTAALMEDENIDDNGDR